MLGAIFSAILAIIVGIVRGIIYLFMLIIKFLGVLINIIIKILSVLWKFIASLFKIIISGIGKIFTFMWKGIVSLWKIIISFFTKGGTIVSSVAKTSGVTKTVATAITGTALTVGSGTVQTTKTIGQTATNIAKGATKVAGTALKSSGRAIRRITNLEKLLMKNAKQSRVLGKTVLKRNHTFHPKTKDALGRTNIDRMKQGLAPIGKDGKPIELHHLKQQNNGKIIELTNKEHNIHSKTLHRYTNKSEIDRYEFNKWKRQYWKERAKDFE